jgi:hypothetical protein
MSKEETLEKENETLLQKDIAVWKEGFKKLTIIEMESLDRLVTYEKEMNAQNFIKIWEEEWSSDKSKSFEENYKDFRLYIHDKAVEDNSKND